MQECEIREKKVNDRASDEDPKAVAGLARVAEGVDNWDGDSSRRFSKACRAGGGYTDGSCFDRLGDVAASTAGDFGGSYWRAVLIAGSGDGGAGAVAGAAGVGGAR